MTHMNEFRSRNTDATLGQNAINNPANWNTMRSELTNITTGANANGTTNGINVVTSPNATHGNFNVRVDQVAQGDLVRGARFNGTATGAVGESTANGSDDVYRGNVNLDSSIWTFLASSPYGTAALTGQTATVRIGGVDNFEIRSDESIQSFMNRVNSHADTGVIMSFDTMRGVFTMEARGTGEDARVVTGNDQFGFLQHIGLHNVRYGANNPVDTSFPPGVSLPPNATPPSDAVYRFARVAQNAIIYFDGGSALGGIELEQESNSFEIEGLRINLTGNAAVGQTFNINTTQDVDDVMEMIRDFVEQYNNLIRYLNALHTTPRPRAGNSVRGAFFEPLTDEQREAMSDREIERWEEQARTGLHHRDDVLRQIHNDLRRMVQEPVRIGDGQYMRLSNIGITTGYGSGSERLIGMLQIDEAMLRNALETRGEDVERMFTQSPMAAGSQATRNARLADPRSGIATRVDDIISNAISINGSLFERAGREGGVAATDNRMSRQIRDYDDRIFQMQQWLTRRENHFFMMFARMENAMAQANAQMDSLWAFAGM
jgi:flagellar capping protein FliD